jgi:diaminopropionate ammonia-lyase
MSVFVNPHRRDGAVPPPAGEEVLRFHRSLPGYEPTPLRDVAGALLKDESNRFGLPAFKILGASWAVERMLRERPDVRTLCAASAGNHGRAVARAAAWRGLGCRIFLPAAAAAARADAIASEGAEVVRVDGGYEDAVAAAERAGEEPGAANVPDVSYEPDAPAPAWATEGYSTLFREAAEQAGGPIDLVIVPIGVGSLAAAAMRFAAHVDPPAAVFGVEPVTAACVTASLKAGQPVEVPTPGTTMAGLDCARPSAVAWPVLRDGLYGTVTVTDAQAAAAIRELAAVGLEIGESGAAALAALHVLGRSGQLRAGGRVLLIATEGATDPDSYHRAVSARKTIDELLDETRERLERLDPGEAAAAAAEGALLIDIRSDHQRAADGVVPGAIYFPRNVLEWRCDPASDGYDPRVDGLDRRLIVMCNEGYASSLAAANLQDIGFANATDLAGGFQAWRAAGLPVEPL